ncbi:MAG: sulfite exporter TauE/SafE family protein [Desulfobacterales bacterium]|nr:sulfite exporter TauE/SafE family protein [Desulfobacterales bacterium]
MTNPNVIVNIGCSSTLQPKVFISEMDFSLYVLPVWSILSLATLVRSIFGFGEALVAMPLLVNIVDFKTATPLIAMVACTISVAIIIFDLQNIQLNSAWRLAVSSFVGIPLGLPLLKAVDVPLMKVILALVIIGFSAYRLRKPQLLTLDNEKFSFAFGFLDGFLGGAYNVAKPPVAIYGAMRRWSPKTFRATLQGYFLPTLIFIVSGHGVIGFWTPLVLKLYFFLCRFFFWRM